MWNREYRKNSQNVAMTTILSEFSENYREVMLDLYEGILKCDMNLLYAFM